jgi:O-succinylbenzoate synthase
LLRALNRFPRQHTGLDSVRTWTASLHEQQAEEANQAYRRRIYYRSGHDLVTDHSEGLDLDIGH